MKIDIRALLKGGYLLILLSKFPSDLWNRKLSPEKDSWERPRGSVEEEIGRLRPAFSLSVSSRVIRAIRHLAPNSIGEELGSIGSDLKQHRSEAGAYGNVRNKVRHGEELVNASARHTAAALMIYFELLKLGRSAMERADAKKTIRWLLLSQSKEKGYFFGGWALEANGNPDWFSTAGVIEALATTCNVEQVRDAVSVKILRGAITSGLEFFLRDYQTKSLLKSGNCEAAVYINESRSIMDSCEALMKIAALLNEEWIEPQHKDHITKMIVGLLQCQKPNGDVGNEPKMAMENTIMLFALLAISPGYSKSDQIHSCFARIEDLVRPRKGALGLQMNEIVFLSIAICQTKDVSMTDTEIAEVREFARSADKPIRLLRRIPRDMMDLYGQNYAYLLSDERTIRSSFLPMAFAKGGSYASRFVARNLTWAQLAAALLGITAGLWTIFLYLKK